MHKLKFANPVGVRNENFSTVRMGTKWAERTEPNGDERVTVELVAPDGKSMGTAIVRGCWTGPLAQLPGMLLESSHDPVCRTWSGAAQVLAGLHPDEKVGYDTVVTCLQLEYTGSIIKTPDLIL